MKKFYFILILFLFSQMTNAQESYESYEVLWEKVKQFEKEALTQSALKVVKDISEKAKKEKNSPQIVKALLYSSKYAMTLEEDAQLKIVNDFKTEINKSEFPSKNILESYLANLYWQYFQQNRYRFYDRTKTETVIDSTDFRTWDLTTLFFTVSTHFRKSLENTSELQKIKVDEFKEILNQKPGSEIYRPTLFDLLAHAALQFYKTNENSITRPADKFEIDNRDLLCEAYQFTQLTIEEKDATSLQSKALKIFQQLVVFHFSDLGFKALADVDIERIKYTWQNAVFPKKDQQYLEVLQNSAENLKHNEVSALYQYEIASLYHQWGNTYQPKINEEHRWKHKEALELCNAVISKYPKSRGAEKCKALKSELLSQNLQLTTEQHIPVNKPSRLLVNYKNLDNLSLSAHKISRNDLKKLNDLYPESKQLAFIKNLPVAKQWEANLKNEKDYQSHTIEILLPPLDNRQYVLLAMPVEGDKEKKVFAFSPVLITDLALGETRTSEYHNFQVIDRSNGKPLQGAKLQLTFKENYDRGFLTKNFVADGKGLVQIPLPSKRWTSVGARLNYKDDLAYFGEYYINQKVNTRTLHSINYTAFMFTDRSMYRPGQPLYFKGVAVARENDVSSVKSGISVTVALRDVNYQEVAKQEFVTNEYGSFSGEFILPSNGLTGNFSLQVSSKEVNINGNANFSVEEYKRPKFETSFEPVTETYRVNDSIMVKGVAKAYAGSNITDAKVNYRVKRVVYFPGWYYWSRPYYSGTPQEIVYGQTVTDASGAYQISFKAIPDTSIDKKNLPTFSYEITADVTDINGETRSASTIVRVGYHALTANISVANSLDKDAKDHKVDISTTNLNGQFVPAKGSLKIYKLEAPDKVLRPRPWAAPDYKNWSKPEFKQLFPHDAYDNEHEPINWEKGQLVWESAFNTGDSKEIVLNGIKKWESGHYVIELETQDKFKQRVEDKIITNVFSKNDNTLSDNK